MSANLRKRPPARTRVGLLGCGYIARRFHLPVLAGSEGMELVAVAEVDARQREACSRISSGLLVFADYRELLSRCPIDAAVICLPPALHADAAVACFERGLHVYLEKPLATTPEEGERVVAAWRRAGTVGAVGFNLRFHPLVAGMRQAVESGALGEAIGAQTVFCAAGRALPEWKRRRASGGGVLLELASHHVDLARYLFDQEVVEVGALLRSIESEDDCATVELRLAGGALVTMLASLCGAEEDRVAVYGSRGGLVLDRYRSSRLLPVPGRREHGARARLQAAGTALVGVPRTLYDALRPPRERSFAAALAAFAGAARGGGWMGADLEDGWRSLAVVSAAERSAASGSKVVLAGVPGESP